MVEGYLFKAFLALLSKIEVTMNAGQYQIKDQFKLELSVAAKY